MRHGAYIVLSFVVALLAFQVPMSTWEKLAPWLFVASLLLAVVLIPHVGKGVNGAPLDRAGLHELPALRTGQFAVLLYAADYMVRRMNVKERFFRAVLPMAAAVAIVGVLLLAEPDMGALHAGFYIAMGILFLGGVNARMFFVIASVMTIAFMLMIALVGLAARADLRVPGPLSEKHALGKGYQLSHSLIAIGQRNLRRRPGWQRRSCISPPEAHTDFLLAVIGEEFGLVGVVAVILAFL